MGAVLGWLFYLGSSRLLGPGPGFSWSVFRNGFLRPTGSLQACFKPGGEDGADAGKPWWGLARELVRDASEAVRQASLPLLMTNSVSVLAWAVRAVVFLVLFLWPQS